MAAAVATAEGGRKAALLSARGIHKTFEVGQGLVRRSKTRLRAVDSVDFDVYPGETIGLVGESGCGKSTLGRILAGLVTPTAGTLTFDGQNLAANSRLVRRRLRRHMQFIFQDPIASLDPRMRIGEIVGEGLAAFASGTKLQRRQRDEEILGQVGLHRTDLSRFPHQLSGGQQQRVAIARALVVGPKLLVADEPVSALDVSVQAQVLNLLSDLKRELGLTYVFVAHNLAVVSYMSNRIAVMYLGKIVEEGSTTEICSSPLHPYTVALLSAIPKTGRGERSMRVVLKGEVPSAIDPPSGCRFRTRCPIAQPVCAEAEPRLVPVTGNHRAACHFPGAFRADG